MFINNLLEIGSCGGYKQSYLSLCDYYSVPVSTDICFDIDQIYGPNNIKDFNLAEFEIPKQSSGKEIVEALRANTWFESLRIPMNSKISPDLLVNVADMLRQNNCIKILEVTHVTQGNSFLTIGKDLAHNKSLLTINFSNSLIEDKGLIALSTDFFLHSQNLTHIDISACSVEKKGFQFLIPQFLILISGFNFFLFIKGMGVFFKSLYSNQMLLDNLRKLVISNNKLDGDGSNDLGVFLSKSKTLLHLEMANTSPNFTNLVNKVILFT